MDRLFLSSIFFAGIAYILITPIWEGYDEVAHYSYIQLIASGSYRPPDGKAFISKDVEDYALSAPMPYRTEKPFDENGGYTYKSWFMRDRKDQSITHEKPLRERKFNHGTLVNWQLQHPPLYYALLAPLMRLTSGLSWAGEIVLLRICSWSLTFIGLALAFFVTKSYLANKCPEYLSAFSLVCLLWPVLFPGFFAEFCRLGNDALVFFLLSVMWTYFLLHRIGWNRGMTYTIIGLAIFVGCLTKIFFLPISLGFLAFLVYGAIFSDERSLTIHEAIWGIGVGIIAAVVAGIVNIENYGHNLSSFGLSDLTNINKSHISYFLDAAKHPVEILKALSGIFLSFIWGGSASGVSPHPVFYIVQLIMLVVALFYGSLKSSTMPTDLIRLSWSMVIIFFSSLIWYLMVMIGIRGVASGPPGWYLHILYYPLVVLAIGACRKLLDNGKSSYGLFIIIFLYILIFDLFIIWSQMALYSGCAEKLSTSRRYMFDKSFCMGDPSLVMENLRELAFPDYGLGFMILSIIFYGTAMMRLKKSIIDESLVVTVDSNR